jgi:hypothetical protein
MKKVIMILMVLTLTVLVSISWDEPTKVNTTSENVVAPNYILLNDVMKPTFSLLSQQDGSKAIIRNYDSKQVGVLKPGGNMNDLFKLGFCVTCTCTCCGCGFSTYAGSATGNCITCACNSQHKLNNPLFVVTCGSGCGNCFIVSCET